MPIPFLSNIDLNGNQILNVTAQNLGIDPSGSKTGRFWFNTTSGLFNYFDGTKVQSFVSAEALIASLVEKQALIKVSGLLKGDGSGGVAPALEGTDYQGPLTIDSVPTQNSSNSVQSGGVFIALAGKQPTVKVSGILVGDGNGGLSPASAGVDYQAPITVAASKVLVSDTNGKISASPVNVVELGYLSGVKSSIQSQLDNIPKYNYLDGVSCSLADGSTQAQINTAAIAEINRAYPSPVKWDAVVSAVTFTPSDIKKDAMYYFNGTAWVFLYYVTTGVQVADGATAGIVENSEDINFVAGKGAVNQAGKLKTPRNISLSGITAAPKSFDGTANIILEVTAVPASLITGILDVANGGTGAATLPVGQVLIGNGTGAVTGRAIDTTPTLGSESLISSGAVFTAINNAGTVKKYIASNPALNPSGGACVWEITHSLNSRAVIVDVSLSAAPYTQMMVDVAKTSTSVVTVSIVSATAIAAGKYTVTVVG
ncbi:MAG: hypothetical protein RR235_04980 [Oscillospiraceae bacterium]